ncbi:hypothetical protein PTUN_b0369 [Pseudoalteromonas tunicata]|jgi:hypothetical protein|uniref:Lcl C-terminal domain-containing protein n=2 Tax=Pseudoalteromonas tunicata TaxID=314281 RepID=A4C5C6_9GAMM|nr:hypothetical protein PTUN_b0369 [Pseudoalteromonas tunicata]AXT32917.1 DUF1566 domain-containing protein [Pseudoalteromonas tunicata]EAR30758.1 hypothetical protein PTD2_04276 [Pseudoalteromonas tunicata D2]
MKNRMLLSLMLLGLIGFLSYRDHSLPLQTQDSRWQKINRAGVKLSAWQGPWSCVYDLEQHLLWEVKTNDESIHDGDWTYSWFIAQQGQANSGDCYFEQARCDTTDLINRSNQTQLCGVQGWRLPTQAELTALLQHHDRVGQVHVATDYFLHLKHGDYWTSNANQPLSGIYQHLKQGAIAINMSQGSVVTLPYRNAAFVMLVSDVNPKGINTTVHSPQNRVH